MFEKGCFLLKQIKKLCDGDVNKTLLITICQFVFKVYRYAECKKSLPKHTITKITDNYK